MIPSVVARQLRRGVADFLKTSFTTTTPYFEGQGHLPLPDECPGHRPGSDKETLRRDPPDILLTNYKMLDLLLLRPEDRRLWAHPNLRYLVVDELHSFDGGQGTDLACLIRRLRARLRINSADLTCVGTSATASDDSRPG